MARRLLTQTSRDYEVIIVTTQYSKLANSLTTNCVVLSTHYRRTTLPISIQLKNSGRQPSQP